VVAVAATGALAEALAFLTSLASRGRRPPAALTARLGDALFLWFHHVTLTFETIGRAAQPVAGAGPSLTFRFTLGLAVLGGTGFAGWLLARGGRTVAVRAGAGAGRGPTSALTAGLHGAKVAVPYAVVCLAASAGARFTVRLPSNPFVPTGLSVRPAYLSAFLWPLAIGAVAGFAGGVRASSPGRRVSTVPAARQPAEGPPGAEWDRRLRGAVWGGARMFLGAVALAFLGLLVLGAAHPSVTRAYFRAAFAHGVLRGVTLVAATALAVPNLAAWVVFASMGSCVELGGSRSTCLLSYGHFPGGPGGSRLGGAFGRLVPSGPGGPAPTGYLLFLLVPVVAVVLGGAGAAVRARTASRLEAAAVGAAAGVVFALLCVGLVALATADGAVGAGLGRSAASTFRLGPQPVVSGLLALAWGALGGGVGGLARGPGPRGTPPARTAPSAG